MAFFGTKWLIVTNALLGAVVLGLILLVLGAIASETLTDWIHRTSLRN